MLHKNNYRYLLHFRLHLYCRLHKFILNLNILIYNFKKNFLCVQYIYVLYNVTIFKREYDIIAEIIYNIYMFYIHFCDFKNCNIILNVYILYIY